MNGAGSHEVRILGALRTPVTGRSRALQNHDVAALTGPLGAELLASSPRPDRVPEAVVLGNCMGPGGNPGRLAALAAGYGPGCPGWTVDAQCGSGMLAIQQAVDRLALTGGTILAGGVESPSTAPTRSLHGVAYDRAPFAPAGFPDPDMLAAAQDLAWRRGIARELQDALALRSHRRWRETAAEHEAERSRAFEVPDDGPRSLSAAVLARHAPLFPDHPGAARHAVTPGNTARIADGAAAVLLSTVTPGDGSSGDGSVGPATAIRAHGLVAGDPALPGILPAAALREVLDRAGTTLDALAAVEIVEAFAAQALAVLDELDLAEGFNLDPRVNAKGGALALGHPWGASGALAVVRLHHRLLREPVGAVGVAACAIGGGMGSAVILERVA